MCGVLVKAHFPLVPLLGSKNEEKSFFLIFQDEQFETLRKCLRQTSNKMKRPSERLSLTFCHFAWLPVLANRLKISKRRRRVDGVGKYLLHLLA